MCGRFTEKSLASEVARLFRVRVPFLLEPRYNVAPTQSVLVVRATPTGRELVRMKWGLVPAWADDPKIGNRMINARAETAADKPAYRSAFRNRRCLILADGFYEWQRTGAAKKPFIIGLKDGAPFGFAGLWELWTKGDEPLETCTLLTTDANELVRPIHDRMPVILRPEDYDAWLDPNQHDPVALMPLLHPYDGPDPMEIREVGTRVNSPKNDDPQVAEPVAASAPTPTPSPVSARGKRKPRKREPTLFNTDD